MGFAEHLLGISRNLAAAHFLSGFLLFIVGWSYGLPRGIVFGIPILAYSSAFFFSRGDFVGFDFKILRQKFAEIPTLAMVIVLLFLVLNFLFCLLPPAENLEMDALNYHFTIPWQYYLRGAVVNLEWSITDKYPLYLQMAQLPFTVMTFPWIIKIANMMALPILLVGAWHLCRHLGLSQRNTGWTVALISFLALFIKQYGTAMFDLIIASYCLVGVLFLLQAVRSKKKKDLLWGAMLLGMACAAKAFLVYYAMTWFLAYITWKFFFERRPFLKFDLLVASLPLLFAVLFLMPVWLRNFLLTGNPFYPLFLQWFGPVIENKGFHVMMGNSVTQHGYGHSLVDFILGPLRLILPIPRKFDYWTDPVLLVFLIGALFEVRRRWREIPGLLGLLAFLLYTAFFFTSQEARYLYVFWVLIIALGAPSIFSHTHLQLRRTVFTAQVVFGLAMFFLFHRQALEWLSQGPLNQYLSRAAYSFMWNQEVKNRNIHQLCIPNVGTAKRNVSDILYFSVPIKLVQHFNTTLSIRNPRAAEGCDAFLIGNQWVKGRGWIADHFNSKLMLVSKETFLLQYTKDTYELAK